MHSRHLVPAILLGALLAACSESPTSPAKTGTPQGPGPTLSGNATGGLFIGVTALEFGDVPVNATSPQQKVDVINLGSTPIVMSGTGGAPGGSFGSSQDCQGKTLNPGDTCHMFYTFSPTAAGPATATSSGTWNNLPYSITLKGTGTTPSGLLRITSTTLDFGPVTVGTTSPQQTVDITNISSAPIVMSGAGGAPPGNFGGVQDCQGRTLNPGDTCHMFFTFSPTTAGPATSTSSGTWNGVPFNVALKGTGGAAPQQPILISPVGFDFGLVSVGTTSGLQAATVTNVSVTPIVMSGTLGAPGGDFSATEDCQGQTLNPGQSCHMFFGFAPTAVGPASATSTGTWNGQSYSIALKGAGGFTVTGFFPPVGPYPELQLVTAGRAIPLKFSLGGDQGLDIFAAGFPVSWALDCSTMATSMPVAIDTPGHSGLHFDPSTGTYNDVWKTDRAWSGTCRQLEMMFVDGSVMRANFQFR